MYDIAVAQDIVPLGEFKSQAARLLARLRGTHQPLVLTQNGRPAAVLVSPAEFDRWRERLRFLESVAAGLADAESGRTMTAGAVRKRLARRRTSRQKS